MRLTNFHVPTTVFGFALLTWVSAAPAFARSPSSFASSCVNARVVENVLVASCDIGDLWHTHQIASVTLQGIFNAHGGILEDDGSNKPASFQNSCQSNEVQYTGNAREFAFEADTLFALCRTGTGNNYVNTSIRMDGIRNDRGHLRY